MISWAHKRTKILMRNGGWEMAVKYNEKIKVAINQYTNQNIPEARLLFEKLIRSYPEKVESYYYLGKIEGVFFKNTKRAIDLMNKALEITPFYEGCKELSEYNLIEKNLPNALKNAKQALTYNSNCEETLNLLKNSFPNEKFFIREKETIINGEYQNSKDFSQLKYHKIYDACRIERKSPKYIKELLSDSQKELLTQAIEQNSVSQCSEGFVLKIPDG